METYYEKELIINNREIKYNGLFREEELFSTINRFLEEKGYEKREKKTEETVRPESKSVLIELRPFKEKSNFETLMLKIKIRLNNITETVKEENGMKKKYWQGEVCIILDAWSLTDYAGRAMMKPGTYFLKGMINKFLFRSRIELKFKEELVEDAGELTARLKKLFRSYQPEKEKPVSEEEIRKKIGREFRKR